MGTVSFKSRPEKGFSLIEVCIALIVISLLMLPIIQTWNIYVIARKTSDTKAVLDIVNSSLIKYVAKYGRYPIPENPNRAMGAANSGTSATIPGAGWPVCAGDDAVVCRTTVNTVPANQGVLIGTVPYAALGIPYRSAMDGYGRKLTYAVTQALTVAATFDDDSGVIEVMDDAGNSIYGAAAAGASRSHYFIASHGEDASGAFAFSGALVAACNTNANSTDFENCNGDGTFRNNFDVVAGLNVGMFGAGATHFDDYSVTNNRSSTGIWTTIAQTPDIRSANLGNVAIGPCPTNPCVPKAHVDVNGTVLVTGQLRASNICPIGQSFCNEPSTDPLYLPGFSKPFTFSAEHIVGAPPESLLPDNSINGLYTFSTTLTWGHFGAGILCTNGRPLTGLIGVSNGAFTTADEMCLNYAPIPPSSVTNSCAAGQFAKSITFNGSGKFSLNCVPP